MNNKPLLCGSDTIDQMLRDLEGPEPNQLVRIELPSGRVSHIVPELYEYIQALRNARGVYNSQRAAAIAALTTTPKTQYTGGRTR
jgi:hypothetical protein